MSDSAEIILIGSDGIGFPRGHLRERIERIKQWDGGHDYEIRCRVTNHLWYDSIANVQAAIEGDLQEYIEKNVKLSNREIFKTGGHDDLMLVDHPDYSSAEAGPWHGRFIKHRNKMTHLTPKKKRRK